MLPNRALEVKSNHDSRQLPEIWKLVKHAPHTLLRPAIHYTPARYADNALGMHTQQGDYDFGPEDKETGAFTNLDLKLFDA